jgi:hypothetical protein
VFRRTPQEYLGERVRLMYFPDIVQKIPELRRELLFARTFLNRRSAAFDLALAGAVAAPALGSALPLLAIAPYARMLARGALRWGREAPVVAATELTADAVSFGALFAGSVRRLTPVL